MKFALAFALGLLAVVAYTEAGHGGHHSYPSIYNKNTNINRNKNKDRAAVWSAIWDRLLSSQTAVQQQEQFQQCLSYAPCAEKIKGIVAAADHIDDDSGDDDDDDDGFPAVALLGHDGDCHHGGYHCQQKKQYAQIYNKNTNRNRNKNRVAADVWSKITDVLTAYQDVYQTQTQQQSCRPGHPYYAYGCKPSH